MEYKTRIRGNDVSLFKDKINFTSGRKRELLSRVMIDTATSEDKKYKDNRLVAVKEVKIIQNEDNPFVYSVNVEPHHNIIVNEHVLTHQCDGDEDGLLLFLDVILNFSKYYLPSRIGAKMDTPLVISNRVVPEEVDSEAHNVDTSWEYPLEFYTRTQDYPEPKEVKALLETVKDRLGTPGQYEGIGFTHPTSNINEGPKMTMYKEIESMEDKLEAQFALAKHIAAVDPDDQAKRIIQTHFTPDIMGNLRAFGSQKFRCTKCNTKYTRPPLSGGCTKCGNAGIVLTVAPGSVTKYLPISIAITKRFNLSPYARQKMEILAEKVETTISNGGRKQLSLSEFF